MYMNLLITGGVNFLNSYLCAELLKNSVNEIYVLVKNNSDETTEERVLAGISAIVNMVDNTWRQRIHVMTGDIEREGFGLDHQLYTELCSKINSIYYCAAFMDFSADDQESSSSNVRATKGILLFMENIQATVFKRLNFISTAYISELGERSSMTVERSGKQEMHTELQLLLRNYIEKGYPIIIHKPSIVKSTGHERCTQETNIVLKFMKLLNRERLPQFFCNTESSMNLVPVDYFVRSMVYLNESDDNIGKTIHLVSPQDALVKDVIQSISCYLHVTCPAFLPFDESVQQANKINYIFHYINPAQSLQYAQAHPERVHKKSPAYIAEHVQNNVHNRKRENVQV